MKKLVLIVLCGLIFSSISAHAMDAREIMDKVNNLDDGDSQYSKQTIATCKYVVKNNRIKCSERPRVKVIESVRKDFGPKGKDKKSVMIILDPAAERGIGFLQYDYDQAGKDTDQWMYLSALGKVKRIVSGSEDEPKTGSLFGSEFNYEDIEQRHIDDFTYRIVGEEKFRNHKTWIIESLPTPRHARKSNYSKSIQWIDQERFLPLKGELYDRRGKLIKQLSMSDHKKFDGVWVAQKLNINNVQTRRISSIKLNHTALNVKVNDEFLTQRTLTDGSFREQQLSTIRSSN